MIDDLAGLIVAVTTDAATDDLARKHKWVRIIKGVLGLLLLVIIGALIYVTFKYS